MIARARGDACWPGKHNVHSQTQVTFNSHPSSFRTTSEVLLMELRAHAVRPLPIHRIPSDAHGMADQGQAAPDALAHIHQRRLRDAAAAAAVQTVATAQEFQDAVASSADHIDLIGHLDLRDFPVQRLTTTGDKSIRVRAPLQALPLAGSHQSDLWGCILHVLRDSSLIPAPAWASLSVGGSSGSLPGWGARLLCGCGAGACGACRPLQADSLSIGSTGNLGTRTVFTVCHSAYRHCTTVHLGLLSSSDPGTTAAPTLVPVRCWSAVHRTNNTVLVHLIVFPTFLLGTGQSLELPRALQALQADIEIHWMNTEWHGMPPMSLWCCPCNVFVLHKA